jgi:CHAD domain-containing protein
VVWLERVERLDEAVLELQHQLERTNDDQGLARSMLLESAQALATARREVDDSASQLHRLRVQAKAYRYVVEVLAKSLALDSERLARPARTAQQAIGQYLDVRHARKWVAGHRELLSEPLGPDLERNLKRKEKRALKSSRQALRKIAK